MPFLSLGLSEKVLQSIARVGYTHPTPIQTAAIPPILQHRDVLGIAQTGTGKTASFTLPMLSLLEKGRARARMPRSLILEPTRELATQVQESFERYGAGHRLSIALLIGGVSFREQDTKIGRGADVLIATPGRLIDHLKRGKLLLQGIEIFVIDEADRMLDMGFLPDVEEICRSLPFTRQTLLFSATMPEAVQTLVERFLHTPVRVEVSPHSSTGKTVTQLLVAASSAPEKKRAILRKILKEAVDLKNAIIFCNQKRTVSLLARSLEKHGFSVADLHGDLDQSARTRTLEAFRSGQCPLLVASDVAARGLDIPDVSHVINYDVPIHPEDYVHRIGRTGRAGRSGTALTLVTSSNEIHLHAIEKIIGECVSWATEPVTFETAARDASPLEKKPERDSRKRTGTRPFSSQERRKMPRKGTDSEQERDSFSEEKKRSTGEGWEEKRENRSFHKKGKFVERPPSRWAEEPSIIGFGEHIPAFLVASGSRNSRSSKRLSSAQDSSENQKGQ